MKKLLLLFVGIKVGTVLLSAGTHEPQVTDYSGRTNQQALCFEENKGQVHDQDYQPRPDVLFSGQDSNMVFHLKSNGVSYQLSRVDSWKAAEDLFPGTRPDGKDERQHKTPGRITIYRLDINWLNANEKSVMKPGNSLPSTNNYYLPTCPDGALGVRSYESVRYSNLYNGVDLKWYQKDGHLKYDYIVAPYADYMQIQLVVEGATSIYINTQGELVMETPLGQIIEQAPYVTQGMHTLKSKWVLKNNTVSFFIDGVNPGEELTIDPAVRVWGTYYGGEGPDAGYSCACDANSNVYMAGSTQSPNGSAMATSGAYQTLLADIDDAFLVKFNSSGVRQWGTYYGTSGVDIAYTCATDGNGDVYLGGWCDSSSDNSLATPGSHQSAPTGSADAFLAKFNSAGVRQWGTYYGGTGGWTEARCCAVDANGNVFISGLTNVSSSGNAIATAGSHQGAYGGGTMDAFLAKFNSAGVRQWGTFYGGTGEDAAPSCATDGSGNVYITGTTDSPNAGNPIATPGSHQPTFAGPGYNAFLVKFNSSGSRQWGTYYGSLVENGWGSCAVDPGGNVFITGESGDTSTMIATPGSHQFACGGSWDAFLVKFDSSGVRQWGTFYGGYREEYARGCTTDGYGNVFLTGFTLSDTGTAIATSGSQQVVYGGGMWEGDAFLVKFNSAGVRQWGTFYGGADDEAGYSCTTDVNGNIYLGGMTSSDNGIASPGAHQIYPGYILLPPYNDADAFLVKFDACLPVSVSLTSQVSNLNCYGDTNGSATVTASGGSGFTYSWSPNGGTSPTASGLSAGTYTCTVVNGCGDMATQTVTITQPPLLSPSASATNILCNGDSTTVIVTAIGGTPGYTGTGSFSVVAGTYSYTVTDANGCSSTVPVIVAQPSAITSSQAVSLCNGDSLVVGPSIYYSPGTYTDVFSSVNGCDSTVTTNLTVNAAITSSQTVAVCSNDSLVVGSSVYYSSGTYTDVFSSVNGCDSTVTTNLTVNPAIDTTVSINVITVTSNQNGATYQWIDCNNGNQPIGGETGQSYTATANGAYAVIVTLNSCSDTSGCVTILSVASPSPEQAVNIYPNPSTTGDFILLLSRSSAITVTDALGKVVFVDTYDAGRRDLHLEALSDGIYFLTIGDAMGTTTQKLIISR